MVRDGVKYSRVTHDMGDLSRPMYIDDFKTDTAHAMRSRWSSDRMSRVEGGG
jgi:hypothetical protein